MKQIIASKWIQRQGIYILEISINDPLANKLKWIRKQEGLSQRAFCEILNFSPSVLAHIESGRNQSTGFDVIEAILGNDRFAPYAALLVGQILTKEQILDSYERLKSMPGYVEPPAAD
ncbi:helix-turn-helix domain-containing protein [Bacterioplanoides sp.]|uniref:helix-turn-helix domain-containing protein n=1 Tax=Bacterioplanoides sp. TaxID=2066072 RepID=UPI003AFF9D46